MIDIKFEEKKNQLKNLEETELDKFFVHESMSLFREDLRKEKSVSSDRKHKQK